MSMIKFVLIVCIALSIICPIINYTYVFVATKFKFHKYFVKWLIEADTESDLLKPGISWVASILIIGNISISLVLKPLWYIVIELPSRLIDCLSNVLFRPIKKMQFKNELENVNK